LLEGDLIAAELAIPDWRQRIERGPQTMRHRLVLARMTISTGGDATALLGVEPFDSEITAAHRIEIHKLRALSAMTADDQAGALNQLTQAMRLAAHSGHRQTFIDEQATFGALIDSAVARSGHRLFTEKQPEKPANVMGGTRRPPTEPLTERELEILRLLATQYTYREIGEQLPISTNTVKFHVRGIYRKLEVARRSRAVERARSLDLIA
jgi:LuxR family maltose regulon positive regulatory protein